MQLLTYIRKNKNDSLNLADMRKIIMVVLQYKSGPTAARMRNLFEYINSIDPTQDMLALSPLLALVVFFYENLQISPNPVLRRCVVPKCWLIELFVKYYFIS